MERKEERKREVSLEEDLDSKPSTACRRFGEMVGCHFSGNISGSRFKLKHSLDSDEEDEKDEVLERGLDDEDLAAQEETTLVRDRVGW